MVNGQKFIIIGGGISGLVLAYELLKKECHVEIFESSNQLGGLAKTLKWKNFNIDLGPHIYHSPDQDILDYWDIEFPDLLVEKDHWSKNFKKDKLIDYPVSKDFIDSLDNETKQNIYKEIEIGKKADLSKISNYSDYIKVLAGPTLERMFFKKYPEKLWGISTKSLDANWAPKRVTLREEKTPFYWGQWSGVGKNGSSTIINSLEEKILELNGLIHKSTPVKKIVTIDDKVEKLITSSGEITLSSNDKLINTTSYCQISKLLNIQTKLTYRGVILVFLHLNKSSPFPDDADFIYYDDKKISFHRTSDQNSFIENPVKGETVICCEVAFSEGDAKDVMSETELAKLVERDFLNLSFIDEQIKILDKKVIKLPEVYPMFSLGYRDELNKTRQKIDLYRNIFTLGSLAEFAYNDLQILFSKAIDLAEQLTSKTSEMNALVKNQLRFRFDESVEIFGKKIGEGNPVFVIAEIGLNHNGDINIAKKLIDEALFAGADAVKLQSYISEVRVAKEGKTSRYVEKILNIEETDFEMFKKNELSFSDTQVLFEYAKSKNIPIFSAPFDIESVSRLEELKTDCYKIASFDLVNYPLLRAVAKTGKPIILSTGMANLAEIEDALREIYNCGNSKLILLQCTSSYPCPPESMNIKAIDTMKSAFQVPVGLSDHVIGDSVAIAAVARGANIIEKHFTIDKKMEGPDHVLSLTPFEMKDMIEKIKLVEAAIGDGIKQPANHELATMIRFRKTMYAKHDLKAGHVISLEDIVYKGPAYGIYAKYESLVVGMRTKRKIGEDQPITWEALLDE